MTSPHRTLALERRRDLVATLHDQPGLHVRELERRTGMPFSTLRHHLRALERHGLVEARTEGPSTHYFVRGPDAPPVVLAALRQDPLRRVLVLLLHAGGGTSYRTLLRLSGLPPSTLSTQLHVLARRGLVERFPSGRESVYAVTEPDEVLDALVRHRDSFHDPYVDALVAAVGA